MIRRGMPANFCLQRFKGMVSKSLFCTSTFYTNNVKKLFAKAIVMNAQSVVIRIQMPGRYLYSLNDTVADQITDQNVSR